MASSISHYKQTPQDEATVEHFAATGWRTGLTEMKAMMDWTTCRGAESHRVLRPGYGGPARLGRPARVLVARQESPGAVTFRAFQAMVNRETMMIRGGRHVAKAIILDNAESAWVGWAEESLEGK